MAGPSTPRPINRVPRGEVVLAGGDERSPWSDFRCSMGCRVPSLLSVQNPIEESSPSPFYPDAKKVDLQRRVFTNALTFLLPLTFTFYLIRRVFTLSFSVPKKWNSPSELTKIPLRIRRKPGSPLVGGAGGSFGAMTHKRLCRKPKRLALSS